MNTLREQDLDTEQEMSHGAALRRLFKFELRGLIGRIFFNRKPPDIKAKKRLLHLGCGNVIFDSWVNADYYSVTPWARIRARKAGINATQVSRK